MLFKRIFFSSSLLVFLGSAAPTLAFDPNYILSDNELTDAFSMDLNQIRSFLSTKGALGGLRLPDHTGKVRWVADIIWYAAQNHGINPQVLLVMLQKEQSLVEDDAPSQKQLDWAMGYGVCDDCSMNDPAVQRWQGFGKQVNSAAMQFSEGYLVDIATTGVTAGKYGPGIAITVSGETVTPQNAATAALYAYTPHIHGNENFSEIWQAWFGKNYPSGTLAQVPGEDGVWLLERGYRRAITSESALLSRFNSDLIVSISQSNLESYPEGSPIALPNYSLVEDEDGARYLLVDDTLRKIDSVATFRSIGYSEDELVPITNEERARYTEGSLITTASIAPSGQLYELSTNGARFFVQDGKRHAIFDLSIFENRFSGKRTTIVSPMVLEQLSEGAPIKLQDGTLVKTPSDPTVYVISEGLRRAISSESIFLSMGYSWKNIIDVSEDVLGLHKLGEPVASTN